MPSAIVLASPNGKIPLPPSPPKSPEPSVTVSRLLRLFQIHKEGRRQGSPWHKVGLPPRDYNQLLETLDKAEFESLRGYVEDKLR